VANLAETKCPICGGLCGATIKKGLFIKVECVYCNWKSKDVEDAEKIFGKEII